jgi:molybdate transport system regulatory protein
MFNGNASWGPRVRAWVERDGVKILGPGRAELLELIDRHKSISAAKHMNMSYRRAWELVQAVNEAASEPFVVKAARGTCGGRATLTPCGRQAVAEYKRLAAELTRDAERVTGEPQSAQALPSANAPVT